MTARLEGIPWPLALAFAALAASLGAIAGIDPTTAIGVALGIALVLLVLASLTAGLVAFTLIAFLEYTLTGGPVLSLTKVAGAVLAAAWLGRMAIARDEDTFLSAHPLATYALLALLGWGTLSVTWSEAPSETILDVTRYLQVMILFLIVYSAVRTRAQAAWVLGAFLLGAAVTAAYGLLSRPSADPAESARIASTVGDPNVLAAILVAALALALGAALALRSSPALRGAALGIGFMCLISFIYTGSRGGVIALAAALVVSVLVAGRWKPQMFATALAVAAGAVLLFAAFAPQEIRERISETTAGEVRSNEGRLTVWQVGLRMVEDQPVRGVGLGSFETSSIHYVLEPGALTRTDQVIDTPKVAHNIYLQALAEMGIVGLLLLLAVLGFPIACAVRAARNFERRGDRELEIMARALVVALAGILAADFFVSETFNKLLWLLLGLGPALLAISLTGPGGAGRRRASG